MEQSIYQHTPLEDATPYLLIRGGVILAPHIPSGLLAQDIVICEQRIHALGAPGTLSLPHIPHREIAAEGCLVLPGFVNAHTHSPENLLKATMPSLPVEMWGIPFYGDFLPWTPQMTYLSVLWGAREMLKTGTTAVLDHLWTVDGVSREHLHAAMRAYRDSGLRATVAPFIEDQDLLLQAARQHGLPLPSHPFTERFEQWSSLDEQVSILEEMLSTWHGSAAGRLQCMPGPVGIQWCSPALMQRCLTLMDHYHTGLHLHAVETQLQARTLQEQVGMGGISYLQRQGALGTRTSLAHAIWLEEGDLALLAQTQTTIVHNPISNCRLGSGRFALRDALQHGVPVALGSDGSASNDTQNMFTVMKMTGLLHNQAQEAYQRWPQAAEIVTMATLGGATALGQAHELGQIAPGYLADLVLLNLDTQPFLPLRDPLLHLVYGEVSSAVTTVIVDGQVIVEDGKIVTIDEEALQQEIRAISSTLWPGYQAYLDSLPTTRDVMQLFEQLYQKYQKPTI